MKKKFWGYIPLQEQDFKEIWEDSKIVLDTNILLNLYRYSESTQKDVLRVLEEKKEQFIILDIVINEFFDNRDKEIQKHSNIKTTVYNDMQIKKMKEDIKKYRHLSLDTDELLKIIEEFEQKIKEALDKCETQDFYKNDPVLKKLVEWFDGKLIDNFEEDELEELYKEGEKRFAQNIPPGYKDGKKDEGNRKYNDFIIWKQIMRYALENETNVLFISDDLKEDWIKEINGEKQGPKEELLNEFYINTNGQKIYIYSTTGFLNAYSSYNGDTKKVDSQTMDEIEAIAREYLRAKSNVELINDLYSDKNKQKYNLKHKENLINGNISLKEFKSKDIGSKNKELLDRRIADVIKELLLITNEYFNDEKFCLDNNNFRRLSNIERKLKFLYSQANIYNELLYMEIIEELLDDTKELIDNFIPF